MTDTIDLNAERVLKEPSVVGLIDSLCLRCPQVGRGYFEQVVRLSYQRGYLEGRTQTFEEATKAVG